MDLGPFKIKHGFYQGFSMKFQVLLTSKPIYRIHQKKASEPEIHENQKSQFS